MKRTDLFRMAAVLSVAIILPITGCTDPDFVPSKDELRWMGVGLNETGATEEGVEQMSDALNQFGIDIYLKLLNGTENVFLSPYSIFTALSMTYEGARGKTASEMASVMHYPSDDDMRRASFARIQNLIRNGTDDYDLSSPNKIWPGKGESFLQTFYDMIVEYYYGGIEDLDFDKDPEGSREMINHWVENQTNDRIKDLLPQGSIDPSTVMVLTNAIYFLGDWIYQFNEKETKEADFRLSTGAAVKVLTMGMKVEDGLNYYADDDLQAVELPYKGGDLSMTILLPKGSISDLESSLTAESMEDITGKMESRKDIQVFLPRFEITTPSYKLKDPLISLGMIEAFGSADFSGMNGGGGIWIDNVYHKAFVKVDEEGTEATAATAVVVVKSSAGPPIFRADHPFIFMITQKETGSILFLGKVEDPR